MARKKLIAGNWKMNGLLADGVELAKEIAAEVKKIGKPECEFLVCPPATLLTSVKKALRGAKVALGAQDCHWENKGAHTGDISPAMIKEIGCSYVILGHSERRADHCEINEIVQKKARAAHENGLKTIICESEAERDAGKALDVCTKQISGSVPDNATAADTVIAYEPIWAIGTGRTATPEQAEEVCAAIRAQLAVLFGEETAQAMRILYGGSMNPGNVDVLVAEPDIDGGLIGGASLKRDSFIQLVKAVMQ